MILSKFIYLLKILNKIHIIIHNQIINIYNNIPIIKINI
jgi:hypothetical protein